MSRMYDLLGVISPSSATVARAGEGASDIPLTHVVVPAVAVGIAGFMKWKAHPVLGFFAGESVGANAYRLYRGEGNDRTLAACGLGTQAAAVTASLLCPKHPFLGYLGGFALGSAVTAFVPGSNLFNFLGK